MIAFASFAKFGARPALCLLVFRAGAALGPAGPEHLHCLCRWPVYHPSRGSRPAPRLQTFRPAQDNLGPVGPGGLSVIQPFWAGGAVLDLWELVWGLPSDVVR